MFVTGALLSVFYGCHADHGTAEDELVIAIGSRPTNLDPRFAPDAFSDKISKLIFSPLLQRNAQGLLEGHLASAIDRPDELTWVATLRRDAYFHDGSRVTAEDVVATYRSILDPSLGTIKRLFLEPIDSVQAPAPYSVVFKLKRAYAPFPEVLAGIGVAPARSLATLGLDFREELVGSGPFLFDSSTTDGQILLRRNSNWFGGDVKMESLRFRVIPDATVRVLELLHGSADLSQNDIPPHVVERLATEPELVVQTGQSTLSKYLAFNLKHPALADRRVRQAIAHAINREDIIRYKLRGYATSASSFLLPESWAYAESSKKYPYNPKRSEELLDAAGLKRPSPDAPRLELTYRTSMDQTSIDVAQILGRQLREVGIEVVLRSNEWGVFFSDIKQGDFDLYSLTAVGVTDPDWYRYVFHSDSFPPDGANRPHYHQSRVDELLDLGRRATDREERRIAYREVQEITSQDIPLLPLWYQHTVAVTRSNVHGFEPNPFADMNSLTSTWKSSVEGQQ
jgi:peptide/nickel transport system substrate-binding protein